MPRNGAGCGGRRGCSKVATCASVRQRGVDAAGRVSEPLGGGRGRQPLDPATVMCCRYPAIRAHSSSAAWATVPVPGKVTSVSRWPTLDQRDAFGAALQRQPGEPLQVLGEGWRPQLAAQALVHVGVVDDRLLQDEPPGVPAGCAAARR